MWITNIVGLPKEFHYKALVVQLRTGQLVIGFTDGDSYFDSKGQSIPTALIARVMVIPIEEQIPEPELPF